MFEKILPITIVFVFLLNLYMFLIPSTSNSYSITQTFDDYHAVDNWNSPDYADGFFDDDEHLDLVFNDGCIYLTRAETKIEMHSSECEQKNPAFRTQANQGPKIGGQKVFQGLSTSRPHFAILQSFAAKKSEQNWKVYEQVNLNTTVWEILPDGIIVTAEASTADKLDAAWYFVSHLFTFILN